MKRLLNAVAAGLAVVGVGSALGYLPPAVRVPAFVAAVLVAGVVALKQVRAKRTAAEGPRMNPSTDRNELGKLVKVGVGALVVLAVVAVGAGAVWYFQRNVLPTCGSPEATALVKQIVSEGLAKGLTPEQVAVATRSVTLSLEMVERGELTSGGNTRKCSAQLVAALDAEMKRFASENHRDGFEGVRNDAADRFSIPVDYELKALDSQSSPWAASVSGSLPLAAFQSAVSELVKTYQPPKAVLHNSNGTGEAPVTNASAATLPSPWFGERECCAGTSRDEYAATLLVTATADKPRVAIDVVKYAGQATCTANITGTLNIDGTTARIGPPFMTQADTPKPEAGDDPCDLVFELQSDGSVRVIEKVLDATTGDTSCHSYHGFRCPFGGEYRLIDKR